MQKLKCPSCKNTININLDKISDKAFCTFCGYAFTMQDIQNAKNNTGNDDNEYKLKIEAERISNQSSATKAYNDLLALETENPKSLEVQRALLLFGRLYERDGKHVDFSVIHCYLLQLFLEPAEIKKSKRSDMMTELFDSPRLSKCLELTDDKNGFLIDYYSSISEKFINLFLKGSNQYMRNLFGFSFSKKASKNLAPPCAKMLTNIFKCKDLPDANRIILLHSFYNSFKNAVDGDVSFIDELVDNSILHIVKQGTPVIETTK